MKLTKEEHAKLDENIKVLKSLFEDQVGRLASKRSTSADNEFIKMLGRKYISPTGLLDLLEDFDLMEAKECACAGPCKASCVSPCASRCNAATYDVCHGQNE